MTAEWGGKEVLISGLALAILPSLDSVTPSAKWRGWDGCGLDKAGRPSPGCVRRSPVPADLRGLGGGTRGQEFLGPSAPLCPCPAQRG